jgi:hypothetical protein
MSMPREPKATVRFVDQYCPYYRDVFPEVRSFAYLRLSRFKLTRLLTL